MSCLRALRFLDVTAFAFINFRWSHDTATTLRGVGACSALLAASAQRSDGGALGRGARGSFPRAGSRAAVNDHEVRCCAAAGPKRLKPARTVIFHACSDRPWERSHKGVHQLFRICWLMDTAIPLVGGARYPPVHSGKVGCKAFHAKTLKF